MKILIALLLMTTAVSAAEDSPLVKETLRDFDKQLARKDSHWTSVPPDNMPVFGMDAKPIYGIVPLKSVQKAFEERNEKYKAEAREAARKAFGADEETNIDRLQREWVELRGNREFAEEDKNQIYTHLRCRGRDRC